MQLVVIMFLCDRDELSLEGIEQYYVPVEKEHWKFDALCDMYDKILVQQAIIFCNSKKKVSLAWHLIGLYPPY